MSSGTHLFRFSLTTLFGAVLFVAFGMAAIRFASPLWAGLTMAVTVPVLFAAILGALFRLGQARAFWTGLAICGWGYLLLVLAPWFEAGVWQYLPTSYLLSYTHERFQSGATMAYDAVDVGLPMVASSGSGTTLLSYGAGQGLRIWNTGTASDSGLMVWTGHALFALLFGFIGGVTAKWFYLTRSPRDEERRQA
jgi:hypothetical protein